MDGGRQDSAIASDPSHAPLAEDHRAPSSPRPAWRLPSSCALCLRPSGTECTPGLSCPARAQRLEKVERSLFARTQRTWCGAPGTSSLVLVSTLYTE